MKLIIDIDETDYKHIKSIRRIMKNSDTFQRIATKLFLAVQDGEVVYSMYVAPVAGNMNTDMRWFIQASKDTE